MLGSITTVSTILAVLPGSRGKSGFNNPSSMAADGGQNQYFINILCFFVRKSWICKWGYRKIWMGRQFVKLSKLFSICYFHPIIHLAVCLSKIIILLTSVIYLTLLLSVLVLDPILLWIFWVVCAISVVPVIHIGLTTYRVCAYLVNCATRWSLLLLIGYWCWSSIFHNPDDREI